VTRHTFITLLGGAAAAWRLTARAQPTERMRRIGILLPATEDDKFRLGRKRPVQGSRRQKDLDEAKVALREIGADGRRAGAVIGSIRAMFKSDTRNRTSLDINRSEKKSMRRKFCEMQVHISVARLMRCAR
jgi:hypothetical protein